jgi:hypothetical protein
MSGICAWGKAFRVIEHAVFFGAFFYLVLLFAVSLTATSLVMWLYRRRVLALMSSGSAAEADTPAPPAAPAFSRAATVPLEPQALLNGSTERQRQLRQLLVLACGVFALVAGVVTTLSPEVVLDTRAASAAPRSAGVTLLLAVLDVLVIAALCMPLVLIGVSHPRFSRLYWRRFVPWLLVVGTWRVGLAASGNEWHGVAAGILILPIIGVFVLVFYMAFARRHARQVAPLLGTLLGIVMGALALGGALAFFGAEHCADSLPTQLLLYFLGLMVFPLAGLRAAQIAVRWLASGYAAKRFSDAQVQVGNWLLCVTAISSLVVIDFDFSREQAGPWAPLVLLATAAAVLAYGLGLRRLQPWPAPRSLLLLRVFAHDERGEKLLDETAYRWRFIGPIHMIAGPDMAQQSMEPHELLAFLSGRVQQQFVVSREQLQQRLTSLDEAPDPDQRFRVNELFCQGDIWKTAVDALVDRSDAVLLDLRGFTEQRRGTSHEIGLLAQRNLLHLTVCLVDKATDRDAVRDAVRCANPRAGLEQAQVLDADQGLQAEQLFEALAAAATRPWQPGAGAEK